MADTQHSMNGFLFDLDGVIVDTTRYHYIAWRKLANDLGFDITAEQHNSLQGKSRMDCLEQILEWGGMYMSEAEKMYWSDIKNNRYVELIGNMKPSEVLPGVLPFLSLTMKKGIKMALISSSRNARAVLHSTQLDIFFSAVIDGTMIKNSKPDPERYMLAAAQLGLLVSDCIVFEDTDAGIQGAVLSGCTTIAIGRTTVPPNCPLAAENFEELNPDDILHQLHRSKISRQTDHAFTQTS
ncbi:MAG: beta-phosphoglucomutase [Lewinellaceae bacterium]|nr:beta-phosphoglucomutase [Lewinellaceae bacterium]